MKLKRSEENVKHELQKMKDIENKNDMIKDKEHIMKSATWMH